MNDTRLTAKTTTEAELRAYAEQGLNWVQVAEKTGIKAGLIRVAASVLGIRSAYNSGNYGLGSERQAKLSTYVDRMAVGETIGQIAKSEGVSRQAINHALKKHGLPTCVLEAVRHKHAQAGQKREAA